MQMLISRSPRGRAAALLATILVSSVPFTAANADPINVLFVGNSFTYGDAAGGPNLVQPYHPESVTDLNGSRIGGVPSLFKAFTAERGLSYNVSLETVPGVGLDYHYANKNALINQSWDQVVLQSYSTLDGARPGNPASLIQYSGLFANELYAKNPNVDIHLDATWSRADQTYKVTTSPWFGKDIYAMETDVRNGYNQAKAANAHIDDVIQTGDAWARAMMDGFADTNPYDGIDAGKVDLWAPEGYHASVFGYYLEGLMFFGDLTKLDPELIGYDQVAKDLGISDIQAAALQTYAARALGIPEPETYALVLLGAVGLVLSRRRRARG